MQKWNEYLLRFVSWKGMVIEMKKRIAIILCIILVISLLTACAGSADFAPAPMAQPPQNDSMFAMSDMMERADLWYDDFEAESVSETSTAEGGITGIAAPAAESFAEKIIYTVSADIETMEFDETITGINALIVSYNAFIENSSISGQSYHSRLSGWHPYRSAHFTIRVPKEHLDAMTDRLESLGNVLHRNIHATNITSQFIDTQAHLNALTVQEESLLDMLRRAEDVPDLILIEARLSDVRHQIESITSTLRNWQNQVDFSTLHLSIMEVENFTERPELNRTYWQQIGDGFMSSIRGVGRFFMDLFRWLIVSAPVLAVLAVVAIVTIIIVRKKLKTIAKKKASMPKPPPYQYPPMQGPGYAAPPKEPPSQENENQ